MGPIQVHLVGGAQRLGDAFFAASNWAASALSAASAYRKVYFILRDFRGLSG